MVDARVLSILIPFSLGSIEIPQYLSAADPLALTTRYDGATPVAADGEEDSSDQAQVETPVKNLRWALQHCRVVDLDIEGGIVVADASFHDNLVNLLTKASKSDTNAKRTPIVLSRCHPSSSIVLLTCRVQPTYCLLLLTRSRQLLQ